MEVSEERQWDFPNEILYAIAYSMDQITDLYILYKVNKAWEGIARAVLLDKLAIWLRDLLPKTKSSRILPAAVNAGWSWTDLAKVEGLIKRLNQRYSCKAVILLILFQEANFEISRVIPIRSPNKSNESNSENKVTADILFWLILQQFERLDVKKRVTHLNTNFRHLPSINSYLEQRIGQLESENIPTFLRCTMTRFDSLITVHWPSHCKFSDNLSTVFKKKWLSYPEAIRCKNLFWLRKALEFVKNLRNCYTVGQIKEGSSRTVERCYTPLYSWSVFLFEQYRILKDLPDSLYGQEFLEQAASNLVLMDSSIGDDILIKQIRLLLINIYSELNQVERIKEALRSCKVQGHLEYMANQTMWKGIKEKFREEDWWQEVMLLSAPSEILKNDWIKCFKAMNVSNRASSEQMRERRIVKVKRKKVEQPMDRRT